MRVSLGFWDGSEPHLLTLRHDWACVVLLWMGMDGSMDGVVKMVVCVT